MADCAPPQAANRSPAAGDFSGSAVPAAFYFVPKCKIGQ